MSACIGFALLSTLGNCISSCFHPSSSPTDQISSSISIVSVPISQHFHSTYSEHFSCPLKAARGTLSCCLPVCKTSPPAPIIIFARDLTIFTPKVLGLMYNFAKQVFLIFQEHIYHVINSV
jgi:hypothetical protein